MVFQFGNFFEKPVNILLYEFHAIHKTTIRAQLKCHHGVIQSDEISYVNGSFIWKDVIGWI
jgi:hypothetical protein